MSGADPLKPLIERKELCMHEALFFVIGFLIGSLCGVVVMCVLQINRAGKEPPHE